MDQKVKSSREQEREESYTCVCACVSGLKEVEARIRVLMSVSCVLGLSRCVAIARSLRVCVKNVHEHRFLSITAVNAQSLQGGKSRVVVKHENTDNNDNTNERPNILFRSFFFSR